MQGKLGWEKQKEEEAKEEAGKKREEKEKKRKQKKRKTVEVRKVADVVATTCYSRTNDLTTSKALQWAIK